MTLCNCCEKLIQNHHWRRHISNNIPCNTCKKYYQVFSRTEDYIQLLRKLESGEGMN